MTEALVETLKKSLAEFDRRLRTVRPDQWTNQTPCPDWDVEALVRHVIDGNRKAVAMFDPALEDESPLGDDLIAEWERTSDEVLDTYGADGAFDKVLTLSGRPITVPDHAAMKIGGYAVHAWDLSRAIGADEQMDDEVIEVSLRFFESRRGSLPERAFQEPSADVPQEWTAQDKVLYLAGRTP